METALTTSLADLRARLPELPPRDQFRLGRRADRAAALRDTEARERAFGEISTELDRAAARVAARRKSVPVISYPPELPISQKKDEIKAAIRDHQVVIVAGETGSGKTTQLPKICLELGRGVTGQIGHTQPRRIAARTVAARIAEELDTDLGSTVGYQVRFSDNSSDQTLVKLMTDGILLTELQRDRRLLRYDTLIIDEAHERSLNIDFILGYLKRLLPSRPDLKVIITSATIDPQRFSEHFGEAESNQHSSEAESNQHSSEAESNQHSAGAEGTESEAPQQDLRRGTRYRPNEPGAEGLGRGAGAVGGNRSRTYGEAPVTGPANRASGPVSGRCVGEVPPRGAERSGGFRGVAPRANTVGELPPRGRGAHSGGSGGSPPQASTAQRGVPGGSPPQASTAQRGVPGGRPPGQHVPVIEVSGRTYPVEVRYRPITDPDRPDEEPRDQAQAISDAVDELSAVGPGDILVFLSGEREIRDTADALKERAGEPGGLEVLPLYARLSTAEQYRIFQPHRGRRVVLATNVAETSLTVPGIRYVVDPGTARISRYSYRTKVQRLPIEPISQASANQRKGRCGRLSDGICIRLYSEEDFAARPEFTDPEILRTNLASVILRMAALDLGEMADFPFVDPPEERNVADGVRLLEELGAFAAAASEPRMAGTHPENRHRRGRRRLSDAGRKLAELPVDPRIGRMIIEAAENGCVREVLVIASALSIQDPRERPAEAREAADAMHARFAEPGSDFLAFLHLWDYLRTQQRELSSSAFRRLCRREYLHYLRVREWQDLYGQLRQAAADLGIKLGAGRPDEPAPAAARDGTQDGADRTAIPAGLARQIHISLLSGLLSHVGMRDDGQKTREKRRPLPEFAGARGARFALFPDSSLARKPPSWVIVTELVETSRLWGRIAARIEPEWAEPLAAHLVRHSYSEPHWDARRGAAMALEKVILYGLPIVTDRKVGYARIDPAAARDLFIRHALVAGDWQTRHPFLRHNRELLDGAEELERRARRRGIVVDDQALYDFYDRRLPAQVTSARHFDTWWKKARATTPDLLMFSPEQVTGPGAAAVQPSDYPDEWGPFPLSYEFAPGDPNDGVTVDVPLDRLNQVRAETFGWQVPGLREELVTELIRSLPKQLRVNFVPAPDVARTVLDRLGPADGDLLTVLAAELTRLRGVLVSRDAFDPAKLPAHLQVTFRVLDGGRVLAVGKDPSGLRRQLRPQLQATLAEAARDLTRSGLRSWTIGSLPREFSDGRVRAYPALADAGASVDVRLFATPGEAAQSMRRGTRRLLLVEVPSGAKGIASNLTVPDKLALSRSPYPGAAALVDDCAAAAADEIIARAGGPAWDEPGFARLIAAARSGLAALTAEVITGAARVMAEAHEVEVVLANAAAHAGEPAFADIRAQFSALIYPGFISAAGARRLADLTRYLRAIRQRLDKMAGDQIRDTERMAAVQRVAGAYASTLQALPPARRGAPDVQAIRWMIEELRVSLFAQTLGTPAPVSEKRILAALGQLSGR
jgi:ATP-dependent helicase HrpA